MKVLFISSWYPNSTNALKGLYIKKHAQAIHAAGVNIQVLALTVNPSKKVFEKKVYKVIDDKGIVTHLIELNSRFYKFLHLDLFLQFSFLKKYFYKNIVKEFNPDIIHSNVLYPAAIMGHWLAKKENKPHIITEHWSGVDKFLNKSLYSGLAKKAYSEAKYITAVSGFLKNTLTKQASAEKIIIVPNVVNTERFCYNEKKREADKIIFSCAAHWGRPKRPDLIFNALEEISKKIKQKIVLNVVGVGHLINELKKPEWNFEINYLGNLVPEKLAEVMQGSDYFLHASEMETFSIVIAEALSTGTPVLASNVGAVSELINLKNGVLCENNLESWTNSILELINKNDFDRKEISKEVEKFGKKNIGEQFLRLYNYKPV